MKKFFLFVVALAIGASCFGGCITGELYVAPLSSILSHPVTMEEEPDFYRRRWLNSQPHRSHYRSKDREWNSTYKWRKY